MPVTESTVQSTTQPVVQSTTQPIVQSTTQPIVQPIPQPIVQPIVQPIPQPIVQPIPQPIVQPISQPIPQPIVQPIPQPIAQPISQPVLQSGNRPLTKATAIPVAESGSSVVEPVYPHQPQFTQEYENSQPVSAYQNTSPFSGSSEHLYPINDGVQVTTLNTVSHSPTRTIRHNVIPTAPMSEPPIPEVPSTVAIPISLEPEPEMESKIESEPKPQPVKKLQPPKSVVLTAPTTLERTSTAERPTSPSQTATVSSRPSAYPSLRPLTNHPRNIPSQPARVQDSNVSVIPSLTNPRVSLGSSAPSIGSVPTLSRSPLNSQPMPVYGTPTSAISIPAMNTSESSIPVQNTRSSEAVPAQVSDQNSIYQDLKLSGHGVIVIDDANAYLMEEDNARADPSPNEVEITNDVKDNQPVLHDQPQLLEMNPPPLFAGGIRQDDLPEVPTYMPTPSATPVVVSTYGTNSLSEPVVDSF